VDLCLACFKSLNPLRLWMVEDCFVDCCGVFDHLSCVALTLSLPTSGELRCNCCEDVKLHFANVISCGFSMYGVSVSVSVSG
jgi:hypothetical protein